MSSAETLAFSVFIFCLALLYAWNREGASQLEPTERIPIRCPHAFPQVCLVEKVMWLKRVCKSMDKLFSLTWPQVPHFYNGE